MPALKEAWTTWDRAWDNGLSASRRIELLKECTVPNFTYTNPDTKISDDLPALAEYIPKALEAAGNVAQVKHIQWEENNSQSALQWDMMNTTTEQAILSGWSYGKYDEDGKLVCVADFW